MKTVKSERGTDELLETRKIFEIGKIFLEKIGWKGKMVRVTDHFTATG